MSIIYQNIYKTYAIIKIAWGVKMRIKMYKQFRTYNIRCRVCGRGKPKTAYQGTWRVCEECRKKEK